MIKLPTQPCRYILGAMNNRFLLRLSPDQMFIFIRDEVLRRYYSGHLFSFVVGLIVPRSFTIFISLSVLGCI